MIHDTISGAGGIRPLDLTCSSMTSAGVINSSTIATYLIMGAAMRNEKVTPSGTPVVTKPMKSGTAEQEQNGDAA
jgi:hypothetical protein